MISKDCKPPFVAYRLTPKRQVAPIKIVGVEQWGSVDVFISDRRSPHYPSQLWRTEIEGLLHVQEWVELRKATLRAELAKLEVTEMKLSRRLRELGHE